MKKKSFLYVILMIVFFVLTYLFGNVAFKTKTKIYVNYQNKSTVNYQVKLLDNDIYEDEFLPMGESYISSLVDYIEINYNYEVLYDTKINGFYSYNIDTEVVAYEDDINDSLWKKTYPLTENQVILLNQNDTFVTKASDRIRINFGKYKQILDDFVSKYDIPISGYLMVNFNVQKNLDFKGFRNVIEDDDAIKVIIPLTYDTFKINVIDNNNEIGSYNEFSRLKDVNYLLLVFSAFCLAVALSILAVVIKDILMISKNESKYILERDKILRKYADKIINVNKFYNIKKYNLIYVDSFNELLDVYKKKEAPISFREIKKNYKALFVIIDDENAWIYEMVVSNNKK